MCDGLLIVGSGSQHEVLALKQAAQRQRTGEARDDVGIKRYALQVGFSANHK